MTDFDEKINAALSAEDQLLLDEMGDEPGYFAQAFGLFRGSTGWVSWFIIIVQGLMFLAGAWLAWQFFEATDVATQLRMGLPAVTLLIVSAMLKFSLMPVMQSNRVLREMRRIELLRRQ